MKISHVLTACVVVLLPACFSPYLLPSAYLAISGIPVRGEVTAKRETILMPGDDRWRHVMEVTYRYRPADSQKAESNSHQVSASLYRRLQVGSPVDVVYTPWRVPRSMHIVGMGSALADSTWLSRIPNEEYAFRQFLEFAGMGLMIVLAVIAWRSKRQSHILAAAFCASIVFSAILPMGFFVFPILFGVWRKLPGQGYGWVLLISMALSAPVLYWRIPRPMELPPGDTRNTTAIARRVQVVDHLWSNSEDSGQDLRQPFQMADLEFTPEGAHEPIHVLDRVDLDSVPGLRDGAAVRVFYSSADPQAARIDGGTRTYGEKALVYILGLTFGIGAVLMLVVWPALLLADRVLNRFKGLVTRASGPDVAERVSQLPPDDPRRKALEGYLRARKAPK